MRQIYDAVVVLGAGVTESGTPDVEGRRRVEAGYHFYMDHGPQAVVMTGNSSFHKRSKRTATIPEALAMRGYAIELGIPESAIEVETDAGIP